MKTEAIHFRHSKTGIFVRCLLDALDLLRSPHAWTFALPQAFASAAILGGLLYFHRSPLNFLWAPVVLAIAGEDALHYPQFFRELPHIFSVLEAGASWLLLPLGWAAFVHVLPSVFWDAAPHVGRSLRAGTRRALRIWGGALPAAAIQIGAALFIEQMRMSDIAESPRLFYVAQLASFGLITLVQVLSAYVIPSIMLGNLSWPDAWIRSWALATRNFWITSAFILIPRLPEIPIRLFMARLPGYWDKLDPDSVGPLLGARVLVTLAGIFLTLATTSRFYLHVFGEEDR